jgi:hypothetical protein
VTIPKHQTSAKPESKGNGLPEFIRPIFLWGGISALIFSAVFVAMRKAPGLVDFIFWLIAIWIVLVRYVDIAYFGRETMKIHPEALRDWRRYSVKLLLAAGFLYLLAKILVHQDLI